MLLVTSAASANPTPEFSLFGDTDDVRSGQQVALGDLDGDLDLDAFVVNTNGEANRVYLNTSNTGTDGFVTAGDLGVEDSQGVALGDIDGDNDLDAFVVNVGQNHVWFNDGSGNFSMGAQNIGLANSRAVALGDLNGDNRLDAFVVNSDSDAIYLYNTSTNLFASNNQVNLDTAQGTGVVLHDFDGDGDLDAVVSNNNQASALFVNDGLGGFSQLLTFNDSDRARGVALVDLNGDGQLDLYFSRDNDQLDTIALNTTTNFGDPTVAVSFATQAPAGVTAHNSSSVAFYDQDGVGGVDLAVVSVDNTDLASSSNVVYDVVVGANPSFTARPTLLGARRSTHVALADLDGDSDVDAFFTNFGAKHSVWHLKLAPVANDELVTLNEDSTKTADALTGVLANDSDSEGFNLGDVQLVADVNNGSLTLNADGSYSYTPGPDYFGADSFTYTMTDGTQTSNVATVNITVNNVNDAPVATDDASPSTNEEVPVTISPIISDIDSASLTVTITQQPTSAGQTEGNAGSASVAANNDITFTPALDFFGTATIVYQVSDGSLSDSATISVTVNNVNDVPVSVAETATVAEDGTVNVNLFAQTAAHPNGIVYDVDGDPLTISIEAGDEPSSGAATVTGGVITYTPNANFNGPDSLTYTINDGVSAPITETLNFTVTPVNDGPPNAFGESSIYQTDEDTPLVVNSASGVLANDNAGVDTNETLTAILVLPPAVGSLSLNSDGSFTYTPALNNNGATFFRYKVSDGEQESSAVTASIIINPVNDVPVASDDSLTLDEDDSATSVAVLTNDTDVEGEALSAYGFSDPSKGSVVNNQDGTFSYTPDANENGSDSFEYFVTDSVRFFEATGESITDAATELYVISVPEATTLLIETECDGDSDTILTLYDNGLNLLDTNDDFNDDDYCSRIIYSVSAGDYAIEVSNFDDSGTSNYDIFVTFGDVGTVNVNINSVNDDPIAVADSLSLDEDTVESINVLTNDSDPADNDTLSLVGCTGADLGSIFTNASGILTYTPTADENGVDTLSCTISDGNGGTAQANVQVTINPVNDAPVAVDDSDSTDEDTPVTVNVLTNDSDIDSASLTSTCVADAETNGTISPGVNSGEWVYNPTLNFFGTSTFDCTISDGSLTDTSIVTITVNSVNDLPTLVNNSIGVSVNEEATVSYDLGPNLNDVEDASSSLTVSVTSGPSSGSATVTGQTVNYTGDLNFTGIDNLTYTVIDLDGGTTTGSLVFNVINVNDDPSDLTVTDTTDEDITVTISVAVGVLDVDGDNVDIDVATGCTDGTSGTTINETSTSVQYVPSLNFNGTDSFTCALTDGNGGSATATVNVTINAVNDPPVASPDSGTTNEDSSVSINVTVNDTDVESDTLSIDSCTDGAIGTTGPGATPADVIYTPNANVNGSDSFSCTVVDGNGGSDTATVTVTINPVNDNPTAVNDTLTVAEDGSNTVNVLNNDNDIDAGDSPSLSLCNSGANGTVGPGPNPGEVTYTPNSNYYGSDSFTCTIVDNTTGSATSTVNVTVTPVNDTPVAVDDEYTVDEDTTIVATVGGAVPSVLENDSDVDNLQAPFYANLTVKLISAPVAGDLTLNADGSFSYTPETNSVDAVAFMYEIVDNTGLDSGVFGFAFITINPINDVPVANDDGDPAARLELDEDSSLVIDVLANDTDVANENQTLTVDAITAQPANGSAVITNGGADITYTPNADYFGADSFTYTITDGTDSSTSATVYLLVNNVPDAPVAFNDGLAPDVNTISMNEDTVLTVDALTNDVDVDGDVLSIIELNGAAVGVDVPTDIGDALVTIKDNAGVFSLSVEPDANYYGELNFTYTVSDGDGTTVNSSASVRVTVNNVNDAPSTIDYAFNDGVEDVVYSAATGTLTANISELDPANTHTAHYVGGTASGGSVVVNTDGGFTFTPNANVNGGVSFGYVVRDQGGLDSATQTVTITLDPRNDAPVAVADGTFSLPEDSAPSRYNVVTNDTDIDSDSLYLLSVGAPVPANAGTAQVVDDGGVLVVEFSPTLNFVGSVSIPYTVIDRLDSLDPDALTASATLTLNFTPVNDAPVAVNDSFADATEDVSYTNNVLSNDTDVDAGDTLTAALVPGSAVNGSVVVNSDGSFTFSPDQDFNGDASFSYTIADAAGEPALTAATVTITFAPVDDNPVATGDSYTGATEDVDFVVSNVDGVLGNDTDIDGDALTVHAVGTTVGGTVNLNAAGGFTFSPTQDFFGVASFQYVARDTSDGGANVALDSAPVTVTIDFANTPDAPVSVNDPAAGLEATYTVNEDSTLAVSTAQGILFNDYDVDNNPVSPVGLTAAVVTEPSNGQVNVEDDGSFSYIPNANFNGTDSFTYRSDDGTFVSNVATVTVVINPTNDAPVALGKVFTTNEDVVLTIGAQAGLLVGATDIDDDSSALSAALVSEMPLSQGTISLSADGSFVFTPASNFNGVTTFSYRVLDDDGEPSAPQVVVINVNPVNDAPVAANDGFSIDEDRTLNASPGVKVNDSDVDGDPLTVSLVTGTSNGTLNLNADGSFTYVPNADFNGTDNFTYLVNDGELDSTPANVLIVVDPVNDSPVALGDSYSTSEDQPLSVSSLQGVLANDEDIDGDQLTVQLVQGTSAAEGQLSLAADGSFVYTPALNFNGDATFTYQARDGRASSEVVSVTITVSAVNDAPTARNDAFVTPEDSVLTREAATGLLANDTDVDGDGLTLIGQTSPAHGELVVSETGAFTYTPELNFNGEDSFEYTIRDEAGLESTATVNISVGGNNDAPVAVNDINTTEEDTPVSGDVLENDSDVDGDPLTAELLTPPSPAEGALAFNSDGTYTFTPALNFNGVTRFTYQVLDVASVRSNIAEVEITVTAVNDAPVAVDDEYNTFVNVSGQTQPYVVEDTTFTLIAPGVLGNDTDVDSEALTVTLVDEPSHGSITLNEDGSLSYEPEGDYNGDDSFTYTVSDGELSSDVATVSLTVTSVNDAPVGVADSYEVAEEGTLTVAVEEGLLVNDSDVDEDELSAILVEGPSEAQGALTLNADGSFSFVGALDFTGEVTFSYLTNDGELSSEPSTVTITVTPVNDAPVAVADVYEMNEDTALTVGAASGVLANDYDVDGDELVATLISDVSTEAGNLTLLEDGSFVFEPLEDFNGEVSFTYVAQDSEYSSEEVTVVISVSPVNDPPVAVTDSYEVAEDSVLEVEAPGVLANDFDLDSDASELSVSLLENPSVGELSLSADGSLSYTPPTDFNGEVSFTYLVSDGESSSTAATVRVNVTPVNDAPVIVAPETLEFNVQEEDTLSFTVSATDIDGDPLTYSIEGAPAGSNFDGDTGVFSWIPTWDEAGSYTVVVSVSDGYLSDSRELTLTSSYLDLDEDSLPDTWEESVGLSASSVDSDGDTIDDATEVGDDLEAPSNVDDDDLIDALDSDSDEDGISDADEAGDADLETAPVDSDEDGVADFRDLDSDDDTVLDADDNCRVASNEEQEDLDEDGEGDACDADIDGDGISNELEDELGLNPLSTDSDEDSVSDSEEFGDGEEASDADDDGVIDALDEDSDDDGLSDADEAGDAELATPAVDSDGDGVADYRDTDSDNDNVDDGEDNCRLVDNTEQLDTDGNDLGDACDGDIDGDGVLNEDDNCLSVGNEGQEDLDDDGEGDVCDGDIDGDGVDNDTDNCPTLSNEEQEDLDDDDEGDICDADVDGDGVGNDTDNCLELPNEGQDDLDDDGEGDLCDTDVDGDGVDNADDNCPEDSNEGQEDADNDGEGDLCDAMTDQDGDGVNDDDDNCPEVSNEGQEDLDEDGSGDVCDDDNDDDGLSDDEDNCPDVANEDQLDSDGDGTGDVCDVELDDPEPSKEPDSGCDQAGGAQLPLFTLMLIALLGLIRRRPQVA